MNQLTRRQFIGAAAAFAAAPLLDAKPKFRINYILSSSMYGTLPLKVILPEVARGKGVRLDLPRNLVRLSVGLEDPEDLWEDLQRGFAALD